MTSQEQANRTADNVLTLVRLEKALRHIVDVLGPDQICRCDHGENCGLPDEAHEALRTAKAALALRTFGASGT